MTRALKRAGLKLPIISVPGGREAMAYLSGDPPYADRNRYPLPSILLLDIKMPPIDGFEVLRWLRHNSKFERIPVVILTGSESNQDEKTAYQLGATSFMVKPFDFSNATEFCRSIERLIPET
jgi:DNA-binding response OmpR family regulator